MNQLSPELKELNIWHCWKLVNGQKLPVQTNGKPAKSNDPSTWTSFEEAQAAAEAIGGLALEIVEPYCGIDLDDCINDVGEVRPWAREIIDRFAGVAYAEVSPSGQGIKLLTRARKTPGTRCRHNFHEKQQVECYDNRRFWTVTGDVINGQAEIQDGQAAVDWLCEQYLSQKPQSHEDRSLPSGSSLRDRARAYVDSVPYQGGGRNNAVFSLAGHLYAMSGELGERLGVTEVQDLMRYWNSKLGEPLSDRELMTATDSAGRNGTARSEKPVEILSPLDNDPDVNIDGILKDFNDLPEEFPEDLLEVPGFIGDLIKHNLSTAIYPLPELALGGAIAMMSTLTGGKVEGLRGRTNLYVMGLAPSGGGKDYARGLNREILTRTGFTGIIGSERIGSHAGIITALSDSWNTLFQIDEIGRLLATMQDQKSPHLYNIVSVLLQLYSSAGSVWKADAYADSKKVKTLHFPHCVIYGTSVPDGFWESLSRKNLTEGLIGRFLVFEEPKYVDYVANPERDMPESILERAKLWLEHKPHDGNLAGFDGSCPQKMTVDEEASQRLTRHAISISEKRKEEDSIEAAIWSRHAEKSNKLALLFACSRWKPEAPWPIVRIEDADRAIKLNNWLTRRMLRQAGIHVADTQAERDLLRFKKLLSEKKEWRLNELTRRSQWLRPRDRADILKTLQQAGEITADEIKGRGRPATVYTVV